MGSRGAKGIFDNFPRRLNDIYIGVIIDIHDFSSYIVYEFLYSNSR